GTDSPQKMRPLKENKSEFRFHRTGIRSGPRLPFAPPGVAAQHRSRPAAAKLFEKTTGRKPAEEIKALEAKPDEAGWHGRSLRSH
ncbi:MAG: hypothetical protein WAK34_00180, partial [Rhodoplanes sp.]